MEEGPNQAHQPQCSSLEAEYTSILPRGCEPKFTLNASKKCPQIVGPAGDKLYEALGKQ